jgi:multiple sugar transport system permease protein
VATPTPEPWPRARSSLDVSFGRFFLNSAVIAGLTILANAASCLVTAYAFARLRFPLRRFWFAIMIGTLLLPPTC